MPLYHTLFLCENKGPLTNPPLKLTAWIFTKVAQDNLGDKFTTFHVANHDCQDISTYCEKTMIATIYICCSSYSLLNINEKNTCKSSKKWNEEAEIFFSDAKERQRVGMSSLKMSSFVYGYLMLNFGKWRNVGMCYNSGLKYWNLNIRCIQMKFTCS